MVVRTFKYDPAAALRKRMIRETEVVLLFGLRFPKRLPRIPTVEVGKGSFDPEFAEQFWEEALGLDERQVAVLKSA